MSRHGMPSDRVLVADTGLHRSHTERLAALGILIVLLSGALLVSSCAEGRRPQANPEGRVWPSSSWDTVFYRPLVLEDTVISDPYALEVWGDRLVIVDQIDQRLLILDKQGQLLRKVGRKGAGPGEFQWIRNLYVGDEGSMWVVDGRNQRLTEVKPSYDIGQELSLAGLPWVPLAVVPISSGYAAVTIPARGISFLDASLSLTETVPYPWIDSIPAGFVKSARAAREPGAARWVVTFIYGPGFMVFDGKSGTGYPYIVEVPFHRAITAGMRQAGEDVVDYAAIAVTVADGEIFTLFGGKPRRAGLPDGEPTTIVDVYGMDGDYRRSYRLPGDTNDLATDGEIIYVIQKEPEIAILGLRPGS